MNGYTIYIHNESDSVLICEDEEWFKNDDLPSICDAVHHGVTPKKVAMMLAKQKAEELGYDFSEPKER